MSNETNLVLLRRALDGRYEIEREIGQGAFATVFLAKDLRHDRQVAVKVLRADPTTEEAEIRFAREIRFLARLQHPHILPLHDSGHVLDMLYYVVPFIQGMSLRDRIDRDRQLSIDDTIGIARELTDALDYAHRQGVIHRDVKPENILLSGNHAILADFGIASAIFSRDAQRLTKSGLGGPGTPAYMSPEQLLGDHDLDARSDIYSVACVMYEMLTGKPPFSGPGGFARRFTDTAPRVSSLRRDVPLPLDHAIAKALARASSDRFASAGDFGAALGTAHAPMPPVNESRRRFVVSSAPLVARQREVGELKSLLEQRRFVTLVGPGGVGKTRLASQVAFELRDAYHDEVYFAPLITVTSEDLLVSSIADTLGVVFSGQQDPRSQLLDALRERHLLLVLDSFEHLLGAVELVADIVQYSRDVSVLVTSRERLNIADETTFEVHGLATTAGGTDGASAGEPAVQLFSELLSRSDPSFTLSAEDHEVVHRICRLLGGLPLGIALAASMVRVLSLREIAEELERDLNVLTTPLRDVPTRHRSLRSVFDQSWALLSEPERSALMRLSIMRGGFRREVGMSVGDATLDVLQALVDKSLISRTASGKFEIHDVVRQFSESRLNQFPDLASRAALARSEWFARFVHEREARLVGIELYSILDEIADQIESIRSGWDYAIEHGRDDLVAAYAFGLYRFYVVRGRYDEGEAAFALGERRQAKDPLAALMLTRRAYFAASRGDYATARRLARRSVLILREGFRRSKEMGIALATVALIALMQGKYRAGSRFSSRALTILRETGSEWDTASCLAHLAATQMMLGVYDQAERSFHEAIALFTRVGDPRAQVAALSNLSNLFTEQERLEEARHAGQQAVDLAQSLDDAYLIAASLSNLGHSYLRLGRQAEARPLLERSLACFRNIGRADGICTCHILLSRVGRADGDAASEEQHLREALKVAAKLDATPRIMEIFTELAHLRLTQHEVRWAARLASVASRHPATSERTRREATRVLERIVADYSEFRPGGGQSPATDVDYKPVTRDLLNLPAPLIAE